MTSIGKSAAALLAVLLLTAVARAQPGESTFSGTVLDASNGHPLAGARVVVTATDGVAAAPPAPEMTTGADGRFQLSVPAGVHDVTIAHPDFVPVFRLVRTTAGEGSDVLDPWLEPLVVGGDEPVRPTVLSEQALPALLPYGWSPRGAVWVETGAGFAPPATIHLPVESADGTVLVLTELDLATLRWRALGSATVVGGEVALEVGGGGAFAAVEADAGPLAPAAAVVGELLAASPAPTGEEATAASVSFEPPLVAANEASQVTVSCTLGTPAASGFPLEVEIREQLELADGTSQQGSPRVADLIAYQAPGGGLRSRFWLRPSALAASRILASGGGVDVKVSTYSGQLVVPGDGGGGGGGTPEGPPWVLAVTPAEGAVGVLVGIEPQVSFTKAVAPTSLAGEVVLLRDGVVVETTLLAQGALVTVIPASPLLPQTSYQLRIGGGVTDLEGRALASPVISSFTTAEMTLPTTVRREQVRLIAPDAQGQAHVLGLSGAVPSAALVWVGNLTRSTPTVSVTAAVDGSFDLAVGAALGDRLVLGVLIEGSNQVAFELHPYLSVDQRAAWVDARAARFTTADGIEIEVPAGAFATPSWVRVEPRSLESSPVEAPEAMTPIVAFELDLGGGVALRPLGIRLPAPAGTLTGTFLLNRFVEALGRRGWMIHDLLRLEDGALTNLDPVPLPQAGLAKSLAPSAKTEPSPRPYLTGLAFGGYYQVAQPQEPLAWAVLAVPGFGDFVGFLDSWLTPMISMVTQQVRSLVQSPHLVFALRPSAGNAATVYDLRTGYKIFDQPLTPPAPGALVELPPDLLDDHQPPVPLEGSPVRFYLLPTEGLLLRQLAPGLTAVLSGSTLTVTGDAKAAAPLAAVRLLSLEQGTIEATTALADGSFALEASVTLGHRYLLALGARLQSTSWVQLRLSEALAPSLAGLEVRDAQNRVVVDRGEPVGTRETLRLRPPSGWAVGHYKLRLTPQLRDEFGNAFPATFEVPFEVVAGTVGTSYDLAGVRDVVPMGDLLVVAAQSEGVRVIDASDPRTLRNLLPGTLGFPFPLADPVRGIAVDPHGWVIAVGGAAAGYGQLKILDLQAIDLQAIAADPNNAALRLAAWRGSTLLSDAPGASPTALPDGVPQRVAVVSGDERTAWRVGDPAPAGLTLGPSSAGRYELTVSGQAEPNRAVTLRNLTTGAWRREDSNGSGAFTVSLRVEAGQELELLRNRTSTAYVTLEGAGMVAVDVASVYGEDLADPVAASQLLALTPGYPVPPGAPCGQTAPGAVLAPSDVAVLADPHNLHPLMVATLLRGYGLGLFEASTTEPWRLVAAAGVCGAVEGEAVLTGLELVPQCDRLGDGTLRDYALLSHGAGWLLIADVTDRAAPTLVAKIRLPGMAAGVSFDRVNRRILVAGFGGGLYEVDFGGALSLSPVDANLDGRDDRVLQTLEIPGEDARRVVVAEGTGLAYVGGETRGLTALTLGGPELWILGETAGRWAPIAQAAPFGVPATGDLAGEIRVQLRLPGGLADANGELRVDLLSLGPEGYEIRGAGNSAQLPQLPLTSYQGAQALVLHRQAEQPWEDGYSLFVSEPMVLLADLRASAHYQRSALENEQCERCDLPASPSPKRELLSGHQVGVRLPTALRTALAALYQEHQLDAAEVEIESVPWDLSPSLRQEPTLNPSLGMGDVVPGTLLHSGEMSLTATDLVLKSRGIDFVFTRTYRSQTLGNGPLGPGWDHGYNLHLRELPNGDVDFFDGRGRRERFRKVSEDYATGFESPPGRFATLRRHASGWHLTGEDFTTFKFDRHGRLSAISDPLNEGDTLGTRMDFFYTEDRLSRVTFNERSVVFAYDAEGRLRTLRDDTGREWTYDYVAGRLTTVTTPAILIGVAPYPQGLTETYSYEALEGTYEQKLHRRDNLATVTSAKGEIWLALGYADEAGSGRHERVATQTWGGDALTINNDFAQRKTDVLDRRGKQRSYWHNAQGHLERYVDPLLAETRWEYGVYAGAIEGVAKEHGLVSREIWPDGQETHYTYRHAETAESLRPPTRELGLLSQITRRPAPAGETNGSSAELVTVIGGYHERTLVPGFITDARQATTTMTRDDLGQLIGTSLEVPSTEEGAPAQTITRDLERTAFGEISATTDPRGTLTLVEHEAQGRKKGYPRRVKIDPFGLDLTTSFETDERGNVTRVVDPRGVVSEYVWNELDWLVEARHAAGAPEQMKVVYLYDANGRLVETRRDAGAPGSGQFTAEKIEYGLLGEVTKTARETDPGSEVFLEATREYDANRNLVRFTEPDGKKWRLGYDDRNLLESWTEGEGALLAVGGRQERDVAGRVIAGYDGRNNVWRTAYDGYGRPQEETDPNGNKTQTSYDNNGNPTLVRALGFTGEELARTELFYDQANRLGRIDRLLIEGAATQRLTSIAHYDEGSNVIRQVDPRTSFLDFRYDAANRLEGMWNFTTREGRFFDRDANGNAIREVEKRGLQDGEGGEELFALSRVFDHLNRPIELVDGLGNETKLGYDVRGNLVRVEDPLQKVTLRTFDGLDRLRTQTRPEGISETWAYDSGSRPSHYTDALGNQTRWVYDALGRQSLTIYPDGKVETTTYDASHNPVGVVQPSGSQVVQSFDGANRLTGRTITLGGGVEGPTTETFLYDGLDQLTSATAGGVTTTRGYDTLSRMIRESRGASVLTRQYDAADNVTQLGYPSGVAIERAFDFGNRLQRVGAESQVIYGYRMFDVLESRTLRGITGAMQHDAGRRLVSTDYRTPAGAGVFGEALSWDARGLKTLQKRTDLNAAGRSFSYDDASRLSSAASTASTSSEAFAYTYDEAQNLLSMREANACSAETTELPLDSSGRNRPASVGGEALAWDANGNLAQKGPWQYKYDYRDRLTRVLLNGAEQARYEYDVFDRRVRKTVGGVEHETVWDGWQAIEEYRHEEGSSEPPRLVVRRTYGRGLDEVVKLELDPDGDGTLTEYLPFYDSTGNLALITDVNGKPIERYSYAPYGERTIWVDSTPPTVEQVRVEAGKLVIELSEETSGEALLSAIAAGTLRLQNVTKGEAVAIAVDRPVLTGREARRRLVITGTDPPETTAWPQPGESVELVVEPAALVDLFANQAAAEYRQSFSWPAGELLVDDTAPPRLEQACVVSGRVVELTFSEKVDPALAAGEIQLTGAAVTWQQGADGYVLRTAAPLAAGSYTLSIGTGPLDLAGLGLAGTVSESFNVTETSPERLVYSAPLAGQVASSTIGNLLGFHGLPEDAETGLLYVRHRYYDPELGRFITADPLGYVDGPNRYQLALNDPVNLSDPTGEFVIPCAIAGGISALAGWGINAAFGLEYSWSDAALDFSLGALTCGTGSAIQGLTKVGTVGKAALTVGTDVALTHGTEKTRAFLHGEDVTNAQLLRGAALGVGIGHGVQFGGGRLVGGLSARFSGGSAVDDATVKSASSEADNLVKVFRIQERSGSSVVTGGAFARLRARGSNLVSANRERLRLLHRVYSIDPDVARNALSQAQGGARSSPFISTTFDEAGVRATLNARRALGHDVELLTIVGPRSSGLDFEEAFRTLGGRTKRLHDAALHEFGIPDLLIPGQGTSRSGFRIVGKE